jgi:RNA polymerase sigma-B factor
MAATTLADASPTTRPRRRARDHNGDREDARAAERRLLRRYHRWGDLAAREELCERFLPLARDLALRYTYTDEPLDDLVQVASLGLVKAIDRFEPDRGTKFTSYAAPTILGELKRHFRDKGWALRVPRGLQARALAVSRVMEELSKQLGHSPKPREVARALGCRVEEVLEAREVAASYEATSLNAPTVRDDDEAAPLMDLLGKEDPAYELVEERDMIASTWEALPEMERKVLQLRFMSDLTQRDRRPDRLLADARLPPPAARPQSPRDHSGGRVVKRSTWDRVAHRTQAIPAAGIRSEIFELAGPRERGGGLQLVGVGRS